MKFFNSGLFTTTTLLAAAFAKASEFGLYEILTTSGYAVKAASRDARVTLARRDGEKDTIWVMPRPDQTGEIDNAAFSEGVFILSDGVSLKIGERSENPNQIWTVIDAGDKAIHIKAADGSNLYWTVDGTGVGSNVIAQALDEGCPDCQKFTTVQK